MRTSRRASTMLRLARIHRDAACPTCGARARSSCTDPSGAPVRYTHLQRRAAFRARHKANR